MANSSLSIPLWHKTTFVLLALFGVTVVLLYVSDVLAPKKSGSASLLNAREATAEDTAKNERLFVPQDVRIEDGAILNEDGTFKFSL